MFFWHYYPPPWQQSVTLMCALRSAFASLCATEDNSAREPRRTYYVKCNNLHRGALELAQRAEEGTIAIVTVAAIEEEIIAMKLLE